MPLINIKATAPLPSKEKQDKIAKQISEIFVNELGKANERIVVIFEEIASSNFYFGGKSVEDIKKGE